MTSNEVNVPQMNTVSIATMRAMIKADLDQIMELVIDALHKTSNIPYMMEPLGEEGAVDYGIIAPSPRVVVNGNADRSIYFSPVNIDRVGVMQGADMVFHKYIMNDVLVVRNTFQNSQRFVPSITGARPPSPPRSSTTPMTSSAQSIYSIEEAFSSALALMEGKKRYCLVIYSTAMTSIPVNHFTDAMVKVAVSSCKASLRFTLLYDD